MTTPSPGHTVAATGFADGESDEPGAWTEPGRAPVLGQVNK